MTGRKEPDVIAVCDEAIHKLKEIAVSGRYDRYEIEPDMLRSIITSFMMLKRMIGQREAVPLIESIIFRMDFEIDPGLTPKEGEVFSELLRRLAKGVVEDIKMKENGSVFEVGTVTDLDLWAEGVKLVIKPESAVVAQAVTAPKSVANEESILMTKRELGEKIRSKPKTRAEIRAEIVRDVQKGNAELREKMGVKPGEKVYAGGQPRTKSAANPYVFFKNSAENKNESGNAKMLPVKKDGKKNTPG